MVISSNRHYAFGGTDNQHIAQSGGDCWQNGDMKNHDLHMLAVEGHCERGKADRYSVRSHKTLALPCGGSLGCSLADRICPYRNGLLPPVYANRDFSYPRLASNRHPLLQCIDNQYPRKSSGDSWKSPLLMNPNVDTCKAISLISQNPAIATT